MPARRAGALGQDETARAIRANDATFRLDRQVDARMAKRSTATITMNGAALDDGRIVNAENRAVVKHRQDHRLGKFLNDSDRQRTINSRAKPVKLTSAG